MRERILSAIVGLALIIPAIYYGRQLGIEIVVGIAILIGIDEYVRMATPNHKAVGFGGLALTGLGLYLQIIHGAPAMTTGVLALGAIVLMLLGMFTVPDTKEGAAVGTRLTAGLLYVVVLFSFLPLISRFDGGLAWIALILSVTWAGDTGAYFSGRALGKTKLFERVSPKKTWEGFAGGFVGSIVGALIVQRLGLPNLPVMHAVILGGLLNVFGVVGDLVESMLKRAYGVKDSGWIMPGHGGILDRVDSILFTAPVAWIYATLLQLG